MVLKRKRLGNLFLKSEKQNSDGLLRLWNKLFLKEKNYTNEMRRILHLTGTAGLRREFETQSWRWSGCGKMNTLCPGALV